MPAKKVKPEKGEENQLEDILSILRGKYGEGAIMKLGEARRVDVAVIPTGSFSLDLALGVGGLPRGRIIEIFGPEGAGKSTLAMNVVAQAQRQGGKAAYIDAEHALDPEYSAKLGVRINDLLISQPDNGEEALNILESLVRSSAISVIVVDSVAALTPRAEIEGEMGAQFIGLQARLMSQALRKLTAIAARSQTLIVFINQIRMKIGVMFGCLNYKTKINLADGKTEWIGKIVNQKLNRSLLSYDWRKNQITSKPIQNWYRNGKTDKFIQITSYKPYGNGRSQFACTPNHPVLTPTGWQRAEHLKTGDHILIAAPHKLNDFQLEIIRGSLMGDGALSYSHKRKNSWGVRFRMGHGIRQKNYLLWKSRLFKNIKHSITTNKKGATFFDLTPLVELYDLRKEMYQGKHKVLSADFVSSLTPQSLAIWYMDDGHLDIRNKAGTKGRIATCVEKIHPQGRTLLQNFLETRYDIGARLGHQGKNSVIFLDQKNAEKFMRLIRRYIHPSMNYKLLPQHRGYFNPEIDFKEKTDWKPISVPVTETKEKPKTKSMVRFDIGVRKTHNFLADGAILHNSPETTPGGRALKFYSSVRIDVRRVAQVKKGEEIIGSRVRAKVVKNKVAPPFKLAEFDIMFGTGISYEADVLNAALKYGVVTKSGASYSLEGEKLGTGFEKVREKLTEDKKLLSEIKKKTTDKIKTA